MNISETVTGLCSNSSRKSDSYLLLTSEKHGSKNLIGQSILRVKERDVLATPKRTSALKKVYKTKERNTIY